MFRFSASALGSGRRGTRRLGSEDLSCKTDFHHSAKGISVVLDKSVFGLQGGNVNYLAFA